MKSWIRIIVVVFILIGGAAFFGYWSINQFGRAFDNLSAAYLANIAPVYLPFKQNSELASTSPATSVTLATSTNPELSFAFPQKGTEVYIGCTYPVSWQSSTTIISLEAVLIDAGTRETVGPIASGLARENIIKPNSQSLGWKAGVVWPGEYFILISKINGAEVEIESRSFMIRKMPEDISASKRENMCEESGGFF